MQTKIRRHNQRERGKRHVIGRKPASIRAEVSCYEVLQCRKWRPQLQLTGVTTSLPLLIGAVEAKLKATVEVAQRFLPRVGQCPPPQKNESFGSGSGHIVFSGKNRCVVTPNVMCNGGTEVVDTTSSELE